MKSTRQNRDRITLALHSESDILLPAGLLDGPLSLTEIGAVFLLQAIAQGLTTFENPRLQLPDAAAAFTKFKDLGLVSVTFEGRTLRIKVDLDKVLPAPGSET